MNPGYKLRFQDKLTADLQYILAYLILHFWHNLPTLI